jgi:hypothetical protein
VMIVVIELSYCPCPPYHLKLLLTSHMESQRLYHMSLYVLLHLCLFCYECNWQISVNLVPSEGTPHSNFLLV